MKKNLRVKKLTLSRETLNNLATTDLQAVAGGVTKQVTKKPLLCSAPCTTLTCLC